MVENSEYIAPGQSEAALFEGEKVAGSLPPLTLAMFDAHSKATDQLGQALDTPLLGLVGEVGSLVSALKKKRRDSDGFFGYHEAVVEELGDVLWYVSAIARRGGIAFPSLFDGYSGHGHAGFSGAQSKAGGHRSHEATFDAALLAVAANAGELAKRFSQGAYADSEDGLRFDLTEFVRSLALAAEAAEISLEDAARHNIEKTEDRWPTHVLFPVPFDERSHIDEQLPREMRVLVYERQVNRTNFVFIKSGGILIGDRLTDNHLPHDDYRFHDVFHLAFGAVLGWSPTLRALLKVKRKSEKSIDENEDGARAILIEEGLATWIFETAKRHRFFANTPRLGLDLLKDVKRFVRGYEAERLPMWLWEMAILQGYAVFRELREHRRGVIVTSLKERKIWLEPMNTADLRLCGLDEKTA